MGVKLLSTSGGSVEVNPPATASNFTQTLVPVSSTLAPLVSGTAVASTSGTSIDFTSIPSWVKRISVMFDGVSTNGTSVMQLQIGDSGGIENTGYNATASISVTGNQTQQLTSGFPLSNGATQQATTLFLGAVTLSNLSGNTWVLSGNMSAGALAVTSACAGAKTLSTTLDRVRITTVNGTDTFDAGSINIMYE